MTTCVGYAKLLDVDSSRPLRRQEELVYGPTRFQWRLSRHRPRLGLGLGPGLDGLSLLVPQGVLQHLLDIMIEGIWILIPFLRRCSADGGALLAPFPGIPRPGSLVAPITLHRPLCELLGKLGPLLFLICGRRLLRYRLWLRVGKSSWLLLEDIGAHQLSVASLLGIPQARNDLALRRLLHVRRPQIVGMTRQSFHPRHLLLRHALKADLAALHRRGPHEAARLDRGGRRGQQPRGEALPRD
mmetsp:Transcript_104763/g.303196  ORF Transcript_104763/g.303196 Transcript_104763/m.303196 type:complete len:242 (+) Transcript_104763:1068-1793(+)